MSAPVARVVYPYPHPDSNPTLANLAAELGARGWKVIFHCQGGDARWDGKGLVSEGRPSPLNPVPRGGVGLMGRLTGKVLASLRPRLFEQFGAPSILLGVDPSGLAMAHRLNSRARVPLGYVSFEIMFRDEISPAERPTKDAELAACADVQLALIQDEERAAALVAETGLSRDIMALVPNAPASEEVAPSNQLRERFSIGSDKRIVLYSGTLAGWASLHLLPEMVRHWPERFVLVLHSRAAATPRMAKWLRGLTETGRVVVSPDPVPSAQLNALYASADYLIAPYTPVPDDWTSGDNIRHIGLSSGKVAHAALCGKPILASALPVYVREFATYRCGETYERIGETGKLLERMDAEYDAYAAEARRFYAERLDPRGPTAGFCHRLEALVRGGEVAS